MLAVFSSTSMASLAADLHAETADSKRPAKRKYSDREHESAVESFVGKRCSSNENDLQLIDGIFNLFLWRQRVETLAAKCPLKDMQYREMLVEVILRHHHSDWRLESVSNARGGRADEKPEDAFDLKVFLRNDEFHATIECKSCHVTGKSITRSTAVGVYSDLPAKIEKYVTCDMYTYAIFFKAEMLPALLVVVKQNGHSKHAKLLYEENKRVLQSTAERRRKCKDVEKYQQNGIFRLRMFACFEARDIEVYRYGKRCKSAEFLRLLTSDEAQPIVRQATDFASTYSAFCAMICKSSKENKRLRTE